MVGQRRPSRSCSILIWGGFLLLYAALTAIIDCAQNGGTSTTTVVPLPSTTDKLFSTGTSAVNTEDTSYGSGAGQQTYLTQPSVQDENKTTETSSVTIVIISKIDSL